MPCTACKAAGTAAQRFGPRSRRSVAGSSCAILFARDGRSPGDLDYVSSPLLRARASMELIRAALGLDPAGYRIDPAA